MYANRDDLIARFGEREVNQLESMHEDGELTVNNALSDASELINSYLAKRYHTPINKTEHLKLRCCDIARYLLYFADPTDEVEARYKEAIKWLEAVANNKVEVTFATPLTDDEKSKTLLPPALPVGMSHKGSVFGDDVFATMPIVGGKPWR